MNSSHAMKTCVLILLVTLLCAERVQGLRCYTCLGIGSEFSEKICPPVNCSSADASCASEEVEAIADSYMVKTKSKYCLSFCPNKTYVANIEIPGITIISKLSCCNEDLCNAAVPTGGSTWTLAGLLLLSLGLALLQALL
ncbi:lymphocyte antigen 6C1-like isoform X2 [Mesocricetus auratus]|nr:lymphocyte antigen 6C1-like isoform X2 [Mesocricetus auratus]XP_040592376.1 lymphocyte antigen 6C1-like isoform X2 [Mesocricetus auratus]